MKRIRILTASVLVALAWPLAQVASAATPGAANPTGNPADGAAVFHATCVVCHAPTGRGTMPGMPDFTRANGVLSLPNAVLEQRIHDGFSDGKAPMAMPPKGDNPNLTPGDIRNVIAYLRTTFRH
jgi:mono/diheme cytochrome c family protein